MKEEYVKELSAFMNESMTKLGCLGENFNNNFFDFRICATIIKSWCEKNKMSIFFFLIKKKKKKESSAPRVEETTKNTTTSNDNATNQVIPVVATNQTLDESAIVNANLNPNPNPNPTSNSNPIKNNDNNAQDVDKPIALPKVSRDFADSPSPPGKKTKFCSRFHLSFISLSLQKKKNRAQEVTRRDTIEENAKKKNETRTENVTEKENEKKTKTAKIAIKGNARNRTTTKSNCNYSCLHFKSPIKVHQSVFVSFSHLCSVPPFSLFTLASFHIVSKAFEKMEATAKTVSIQQHADLLYA
ncbi:hypothetical protein RFI_23711 [Reticulomyxa filosa]|uniref:Uncharacterized protein n=1 Tax=Reticulomyxa filosa TaxID=46433 RepID=X6MKP5_RETFI|nr:hypothetical protein RFI_23711 [Reticulomyxa filosa]|eukprot:ETO13655.1 hypothetical protein RFI_23711 [Reticulomyxa filosa]